jgi:signal peptidase I
MRRRLVWAAIAVVMPVFVLFGTGALRFSRVVSGSMEPTIMTGRVVLVARCRSFSRGDVVTLSHGGTDLVKRVVAVGGERAAVRDGLLLVDGWPSSNGYWSGPREWEVGPGEVFVVGDNRAESLDSREFGPVPAASVDGRVVLSFWWPGWHADQEPRPVVVPEEEEASPDAM